MRSPQRDTTSAPKAPTTAAAGPASWGRRPAHPHGGLPHLQRRYGNSRTQGIIQAKLNVGPVGDRYEREADRIASLAMTPSVRREPEAIQHVQGAVGGAADPAVAQAVARARGGGRAVPSAVRERMERVSGADFSAVRLHVDAESDRLNDALGSRAFTVGADVFVRRSEYRPGSAGGDALLGHELTHTVQQGAARPRSSSAPAATTSAMPTPTVQRRVDPNRRRAPSETDIPIPEGGLGPPIEIAPPEEDADRGRMLERLRETVQADVDDESQEAERARQEAERAREAAERARQEAERAREEAERDRSEPPQGG